MSVRNIDEINRRLKEQASQLDTRIQELRKTTLSGRERELATEQCLADIAHFSNEVKDAASQLPSYDVRIHSDISVSLSKKFQEAKSESVPKRKFAFKARPPKKVSAPADDSHLEDSTYQEEAANDSQPILQSAGRNSDTIQIADFRSERVVQPAFELSDGNVHPPSASISSVEGCTIDLRGGSSADKPLAKLQINNARRCLILCGYVSGSAFVSESQNCVILVTCGQMRLYKCENCAVYLHCASDPVIEHSQGINFAPLPGNFIDLESQHKRPNRWDQVQDFNWLLTEPNPHWATIANEDRMPDDLWQTAITGGHENHILQRILSRNI